MGSSFGGLRSAWQPLLPATVLLVFSSLAPALAWAQEPTRSFDQLDTRLKPGDTVWVTDANGQEIKGRIEGLAPASLRLDAGGRVQELDASRVNSIRIQPRDSLKNGVLWGAVAGFALGALSCGVNPECAGDEGAAGVTAGLAVMGSAAGAGIGALVDSVVKGPKLVVYRSPGGSGRAHLSIAPVMTPRARGMAVALSF